MTQDYTEHSSWILLFLLNPKIKDSLHTTSAIILEKVRDRPLVIWNDSLKIGVPEIDRQHKQLIEQLNQLVDAMHNNRGKDEIQEIVKFLDLYVSQHFSFEEGCMNRCRCPVASQNAAAHAYFIKVLSEVKAELRNKGTSLTLAIKVNEQLLDWFVNHIKKVDIQLKNKTNN